MLWRENQRVSLRAFLRSLLHNPQIAQTKAMNEFLTADTMTPTDEDVEDIMRRKAVDARRIEEQQQFYEIARKRAAELDIYMEKFRQDIVERNGLTMLFQEIKEKETIPDLSIQYQKFAEWLRIEVAATIYHLFLAEDNSPELFAQMKRIHSLVPYTLLKNAIRIANPAAVMSSVLDLFLAQPFGSRSLMQRIFSAALNDGIRQFQKNIDAVAAKIGDDVFVQKLKVFTESDETIKTTIREEAVADDVDLIVAVLRSELIEPALTPEQIGRLYNAYVAFNNAVDNVDEELKQGAQLFSYLKQLMKLYTRQRDKAMMLHMIEEPVTLQLLKDLFTIFYEPLVRVYKSANVYNSITDFSVFIDDMIQVSRLFLVGAPKEVLMQLRLSRSAGRKTRRPTPTKPCRPSSTSASATSTTSTSSYMRCTLTTMASSRSLWGGSRAFSSSCGKAPRGGRSTSTHYSRAVSQAGLWTRRKPLRKSTSSFHGKKHARSGTTTKRGKRWRLRGRLAWTQRCLVCRAFIPATSASTTWTWPTWPTMMTRRRRPTRQQKTT